MTIYYKILSVDDQRGSFIVRIWTDKLSEHDLRTFSIDREAMDLYKWETAKTDDDWYANPEVQKNYIDRVTAAGPSKCMTDYNLNIWNPNWTKAELHTFIQQGINIDWLVLQEKIKDPNINTEFTEAKSLIGKSFTIEPQKLQPPRPPKTEGIEEI